MLIITVLLFGGFSTVAQLPYQNASLPVDERVDDLISRMTLSEKVLQLGNQAPAISRLGIPAYDYWSEALHGVARAGLATSFPQAIALSSTWDPGLIYEIGKAISDEARVKNNKEGKGLSYWSPTINMARDPRWGRAEENYGEDPYLASQIAVNFIKGMQGSDPKYLKTVATAKHFACNNIEVNRYGISSEVDERSLREYYLPVFKASVMEGKVYSIMSAYNAVNGVPCPANRTLLTHILRDEWGFKGYVVSDCDAVSNVWNAHNYVPTAAEATAISIMSGTDLNCGSTYPVNATNAIKKGYLTEKDLDNALTRIFKARFLLGEFDPPSMVPYKAIPDSLLDCIAYRELALKAARESIVLLKNQNNILPLNADSIKSIAVIGPNANTVQLGGYSGSPSVSISPLRGIGMKLGIDVSAGYIEAENFSNQKGIQSESCSEGGSNIGYIENGDYTGFNGINFKEGMNKAEFRVASNTSGGNIQIILDDLLENPVGTCVVKGTGGWQNWTTLTVDISVTSGVHNVYLKFTGGAGYLFNVNWFRFYNPDDTVPVPGENKLNYAYGCSIKGNIDQSAFDSAVNLARTSDIAIVVCGTDLSVADEGTDRNSLDLPGFQEQLIKAVFHANPKTILVIVNGFSLSVNWSQDSIPAILSAWYGGQAQGRAIADVLFGDFNPRGKLSTTWFKSAADLPPINDYDIKNNRTYMYFKGTPLYPFGYGLSYTDFSYGNIQISSGTLNPGDSILISSEITNSGTVEGDEIVQLYVHAPSSTLRPIKELKGFRCVHLDPGETQTVEFPLKHEALSVYDPEKREFIVEDGTIDILIGTSSADIRLEGKVNVTGASISGTYRHDPFSLTEAEFFEKKSRTVKTGLCSEGGQCIDSLINNSYIAFKNFSFETNPEQFNANLSSVNTGGAIQLVLDSLDGPVAGILDIVSTGSWDKYETRSCAINGVSGVRDLYLIFKTSAPKACRLNWISFNQSLGYEINPPAHRDGFAMSVYPNPAVSGFSVSYTLRVPAKIRIDIFSAQGILISSYNQKMQGQATYIWEHKKDDPALTPGLYVIKLTSNGFSESKILSLLEPPI